jgi:hypothetical protein
MRVFGTGNFVQDMAADMVKSGGADGILDEAAQAAGFDGFSRMIDIARRGQAALAWFTPDRIGVFAGLGAAGLLAVTRAARPGTSALIGLGTGLATYFIIKSKT